MKKLKYLFTILIALTLFSCSQEPQQTTENGTGSQEIQQTTENENYFNYGDSWNFNVSATKLNTSGDANEYTFTYSTVDQQNNTVTCSAYVAYPKNVTQLDCVVIDCHGTIHNNSEAPTVKNTKGASFSVQELKNIGMNALIIAPDYLGYGVSADKTHPYMITNLCARNIIDAILGVLKNPNHFGNFSLKSGYKSFVIGYSQGGQTSLGTFRAVENYIPTGDKNLINLAKCYSGAGPHDLPATMDSFLSKGPDGNGIVFPNLVYLVIKGILSADYECMQGYELNDFFTDDFLNSNIKAGLDAKNIHTSTYADEFSYFQDLDKLITPALQNKNSQLYKDLKTSLSMNSLASGWTVNKEVYIYQHQNDDMVPPINITKVQAGIGNNNSLVTFCVDDVSITTSGPFDFIHSKSAPYFYINSIADMATKINN